MGTSTDAILFYGYCWDEETDRPWTIGRKDEDEDDHPDEDWMDRYIRAKGSSVDDSTDWSKKRELALASGCEVSTHCSRECPMPFVAVTASGFAPEHLAAAEVDRLPPEVTPVSHGQRLTARGRSRARRRRRPAARSAR